MTDLYAALVAALDAEQQNAEWWCARALRLEENERTLGRIAADRRVLDRHRSPHESTRCWHCHFTWPCPDVLDLAARYDVKVET